VIETKAEDDILRQGSTQLFMDGNIPAFLWLLRLLLSEQNPPSKTPDRAQKQLTPVPIQWLSQE
jgi:hypothetical protein